MTQASEPHPSALADYRVHIVLPIQWGDQDSFGHVNNVVPIRWFESARIFYFDHSGMRPLMKAIGSGPILAAISCNYRRQLHYPDSVLVGARVASVGRTSMVMEHAIYSEKLQAIAAEGSSTIVLFDYANNKPRRIPDDVRTLLERLEGKPLSKT